MRRFACTLCRAAWRESDRTDEAIRSALAHAFDCAPADIAQEDVDCVHDECPQCGRGLGVVEVAPGAAASVSAAIGGRDHLGAVT